MKFFKRNFTAFVVGAMFLSTINAYAEAPAQNPAAANKEEFNDGRRWDLGLQLGSRVGSLTKGASTTATPYGGILTAISIHEPIAKNLLMFATFQISVDIGNFQISSQGFGLGLQYAILGGLRRRVRDFGEVKLLTENPWDLSLVFRGSVHGYSAVNPNNINDTAAGTVYESMGGVSYRRDFGTASAFYAQLLMSLLSMPASTDRLNPQLFEFSVGWRFYL